MTKQELLQNAKPILFNTEMVQAILAGRKTVTRRLIKPNVPGLEMRKMDDDHTPSVMDEEGRHYPQFAIKTPGYDYRGMILWVREAWMNDGTRYLYRANYADGERFFRGGEAVDIKWKPSIHMPKEAARLFLRVTDIRAERLQDITEDGISAEGIRAWSKDGTLHKYAPADNEGDYPNCKWSECPREAIEAMKKLWDSTVKKSDIDHYGWGANPWVWVIEFERVEI